MSDARWMDLALALGRRGRGRTGANPAVGCVIVRDGRVVGRGWTADGGRPHAEAVALAQAGDARGATAYVTLEPCAHRGRGEPCADALTAAGIARAVVAVGDPDLRTNGQGIARLRAAGVEVTVGVGEAGARADLAGFLRRFSTGLPFVTLKLAASLDGRIATASGESRWITGPLARAEVHRLRSVHDAVLVGGGTARADDPRLDVRGMGERPQPVRAVLTRGLDVPVGSHLGRTARERPVVMLHGTGADAGRVAAWEAVGARCVAVADLPGALRVLAAEGVMRVLCEGGGGVAAGLLRAGLVDELWLFHAGLAIGAEGAPMVGGMALDALAQAPRMRLVETRQVGPDALSRWAPSPAAGGPGDPRVPRPLALRAPPP